MYNVTGGFFTGINYWASKNAIHMWKEYDRESIEYDMKLLKEAGITVLRVFPTWNDFQPLTAFCAPGGVFEYGMKGEVCPDTEAGRAGVDEIMCARFEDFCSLAEKYDMKIIVGLLTGHMSFGNLIPPALVNLNIVTSPVALRFEVRYIKYLVKRFKNIKSIVAWDLGNEIENMRDTNTKDEFHIWFTLLSDAIKSCDSTRPVVTGFGKFGIRNDTPNLYDLSESCDIHTVHAYNIFETEADPVNTMKPILDHIFKCRISEDIGKLPAFLQEFGAIGYTNCSLKSEAEFYRATVLSMLAHGFHGVMYWCAFDQGHLTFPPYDWNNIGSNYGFFDKDLHGKPLVRENIRLQSLIGKVGDSLPKYKTNCTIVVPRDECGFDKNMLRSAYMLVKRANLEADFCFAQEQLPNSELYILPSVKYNKAITNTRTNELLEKVWAGAALYISLDRAYFRNAPKLAGVTVNNRVNTSVSKRLIFDDFTLPIRSNVDYDITAESCLVLAKDENGTPIFVKNAYGKGSIYFLFAPLEDYVGNQLGSFYNDNAPEHEKIYRIISQDVKSKKLSKINSRFILSTEHYGEDGSIFIFAVNYSNKPQSAELFVSDAYDLSVVWGESINGSILELEACDGILIKLTKAKQ